MIDGDADAIGLMVVTGIVLLKLTILALAFGWFSVARPRSTSSRAAVEAVDDQVGDRRARRRGR